MSITTMRTKCPSIATFHRPIHSHWSLPLSSEHLVPTTQIYCLTSAIISETQIRIKEYIFKYYDTILHSITKPSFQFLKAKETPCHSGLTTAKNPPGWLVHTDCEYPSHNHRDAAGDEYYRVSMLQP